MNIFDASVKKNFYRIIFEAEKNDAFKQGVYAYRLCTTMSYLSKNYYRIKDNYLDKIEINIIFYGKQKGIPSVYFYKNLRGWGERAYGTEFVDVDIKNFLKGEEDIIRDLIILENIFRDVLSPTSVSAIKELSHEI